MKINPKAIEHLKNAVASLREAQMEVNTDAEYGHIDDLMREIQETIDDSAGL